MLLTWSASWKAKVIKFIFKLVPLVGCLHRILSHFQKFCGLIPCLFKCSFCLLLYFVLPRIQNFHTHKNPNHLCLFQIFIQRMGVRYLADHKWLLLIHTVYSNVRFIIYQINCKQQSFERIVVGRKWYIVVHTQRLTSFKII